ncbi:hypothetical protein C5167_017792 [Papaver somniferum]|uniref:Aminotransferase-like plant mobile domain-containing protein n=1 Tax=Papaver somniferum TaxID=3469 RepID=A0A4Y7IPF3_PAPSO|nr:hypothetical protein C5167_017792 [Papaver somniferum]
MGCEDLCDKVRLIKRQKVAKWDLSLECDEFVVKVKECVLYRAIQLAHVEFDVVAVSAFLERHYPETYTMHLPFREMGITPNDCRNITGFQVEGKFLREGYKPSMSYESLEELAQKFLGWDARKSQCEFRRSVRPPKRGDEYNPREENGALKKKLKKFKLVKLNAAFGGTKKKVEKGKVDAHYLQLLEHLDEMNKYSWAQMSKGSRIKCNQIGGYLTFVQVWIYDHFPKLGLGSEKKPYPYDQPTTGKWLFLDAQKKSKEEQLTSLREKLDELTVNDVVFHPYTVPDDVSVDEDDLNGFSTVSPYYGPIWYPNGYAIYNPRRVLRQLCCVQMDPNVENENFTLLVEGTKNSEKYFEPKHEPTPAEDYMEYYEEISHPFVINKEQQAKTDASKAKGKEREAKRAQKEVPICGEEAKRLWDNVVLKGSKLLKKWMAKIKSGEPMETKEQTAYYKQWEGLITKRMV